MAIHYYENENGKLFQLDTIHTTYLIGILPGGMAAHIYYGERLRQPGGLYLLRLRECPPPEAYPREKVAFLSSYQAEYPTAGVGDFRESCLDVRTESGARGCELFYNSHTIEDGKPALKGLPASFVREETDDKVQTLRLTLSDPVIGLSVTLLYSVFPQEDIITRSALIQNTGSGTDCGTLILERALSACLDMDYEGQEILSLHGAWARERHIQRAPLPYGRMRLESMRGETSPQEHPFLALVSPGTDQRRGEVTAMTLIYSGNFLAQAERSQHDQLRAVLGIHPERFAWTLGPGEVFTAPEAVLTYSAEGLGKMTRSFHDFFREHLIRSPYRKQDPPVLINNWEATYFGFDTDKILAFAAAAAKEGIEMMVLDDGWFGKRDDDNSGLGDWIVNEKKLPGGIRRLGEGIHDLGMKFGLWFEPEMVSPDSELYRAHPDWALQLPGREPSLSRAQLVLDISRREVRDAILEMVFHVIREGGIDYVKWDMNRYLSDVWSAAMPADRQGEVYHRYVLGVYEMQERLLAQFPSLLLENCSAGGARFDAGMLYYSQQIWTSDDTDALERLKIQEGTALVYPLMSMGAHVSKCPNEQVGRVVPFATRANVAMAGTFGYELDVTKLAEDERAQIPGQIRRYHRLHHLMAQGDYYRIHSWRDEAPYDAWMAAAKDGSEAVLTYVQVLGRPNTASERLLLEGLLADARYHIEIAGFKENDPAAAAAAERDAQRFGPGAGMPVPGDYTGEELMKCGFLAPALGDGESRMYHFTKI